MGMFYGRRGISKKIRAKLNSKYLKGSFKNYFSTKLFWILHTKLKKILSFIQKIDLLVLLDSGGIVGC